MGTSFKRDFWVWHTTVETRPWTHFWG